MREGYTAHGAGMKAKGGLRIGDTGGIMPRLEARKLGSLEGKDILDRINRMQG